MAAKESKTESTTAEPLAVQPQVVVPAAVQAESTTKNQVALTIAIISAAALFFVGFGLGYLLGHSTNERTRIPINEIQRPGDGAGRRYYPNSSTN